MSKAMPVPRIYRRGLWSRLVEGLRYGGGVGQWAWLLHRLTGIGILLYLCIHILDTFFVVVNPAYYDEALDLYGGIVRPGSWIPLTAGYYWGIRWAFRLGELGLFASVLFHSVNGLRVLLIDFWPRAARIERTLFGWVVALFFLIMIPVSVWVLLPLGRTPPPRGEEEVPRMRGRVTAEARTAIPGPVRRDAWPAG